MRELALFAGAGGGILGGLLIGWRTVCAVEIDPYARSVLLARQRDGMLQPFPVWDDVRTFDGNPWRGHVDVVSGGFPCQDISCAGKGAGLDGARSGLWSEFARIIGDVRPRYAFMENSPMLVVRGLDRVLADLAAMGFDTEWGVVSAADVGAPHKRDRIWIVAHARGEQCQQRHRADEERGRANEAKQTWVGGSDAPNARRPLLEDRPERKWDWRRRNVEQHACGALADAPCERRGEARKLRRTESAQLASCGSEALPNAECDRRSQMVEPKHGREKSEKSTGASMPPVIGRWPIEPALGRVAHGVAKRVDRLKAIGNGQVPRVAATAWRILSERFEQ